MLRYVDRQQSSRSVHITIAFPVLVIMGLDGAIDAYAVEQTGKNTFFGRTATLLQSVENLGNLQRILMRVVIVLLVSAAPLSRPPFSSA